MLEAVASLREVLAAAAARLADAGCESPRLDAELLLGATLGITRTELFLRPDAQLDAEAAARFEALVARRAVREPVAYLLGERAFRRLTLAVDRNVLIPRPETELLVEYGLGLPHGARVLDVGTGSGAIALALKDQRPDLEVSGSDVSPAAVALARDNARRLGLDVPFAVRDLFSGGASCDAVLANLPYVATGDPLPPEVALYEPSLALQAGPDGLDLIRRLIASLEGVGVVALEIGAGQASSVSDLLRRQGFSALSSMRDLAGHERVVAARR